MALIIPEETKEYMVTVLAKALDNGSIKDLLKKLVYLDQYGKSCEMDLRDKFNVEIHPEFLCNPNDMSFALVWLQGNKPYMNGGLNYHKYDNSWSVNT